jgi:hypothetical protein
LRKWGIQVDGSGKLRPRILRLTSSVDSGLGQTAFRLSCSETKRKDFDRRKIELRARCTMRRKRGQRQIKSIIPGGDLTSVSATESESIGDFLEASARKEIAATLREERVSPDFIYAFEKTSYLVTDENRDLWTAKALREWSRALQEYRQRVKADCRAIDLCFALLHEKGRTDQANKKRFAASEFAIAVLCAHDQGLSSFGVEELFREAWLDHLLRHRRVPEIGSDPTDHHRFEGLDTGVLRKLLDEICEDISYRIWSPTIDKRIAKIEAARSVLSTWLGRMPEGLAEEEPEEVLTIDNLQNAVTHCELEGVPSDVIESMLLRSWVRMMVLNAHSDERFFQILDKNWDQVHARIQVQMAQYSGLSIQ